MPDTMEKKECRRLEAALERMAVKNRAGGSGECANALARRQEEAAAGDCVISHKCPERSRCVLGVEQTWRCRSISRGYLKPLAIYNYNADAIPSQLKYLRNLNSNNNYGE